MNELPGLRHQNSNKDESESGPSSLSSSRGGLIEFHTVWLRSPPTLICGAGWRAILL